MIRGRFGIGIPRRLELLALIDNLNIVRVDERLDDEKYQILKDALGFRKLRVIRPERFGVHGVRGVVKVCGHRPVLGPLAVFGEELVRREMPHLLHRAQQLRKDEPTQALDAHEKLQDVNQSRPFIRNGRLLTRRWHDGAVPTAPLVAVIADEVEKTKRLSVPGASKHSPNGVRIPEQPVQREHRVLLYRPVRLHELPERRAVIGIRFAGC